MSLFLQLNRPVSPSPGFPAAPVLQVKTYFDITFFYFLKRNTCTENNQTALKSLNEWLLFSARLFLQLHSESLPWRESLCFKASVIDFHVAQSRQRLLQAITGY